MKTGYAPVNTDNEFHQSTDWNALALRVLNQEPISRHDALSALECPDDDLLSLLHAAYKVRRAFFGNTVQLYYLMNIKSGLCPEDCHYCSQSKLSTASIPKYQMLSKDEMVAGAHRAFENKACTFCIVASGRGPSDREVDQVIDAVRDIKDSLSIRVCACLGILKPGQAQRLQEAGVDRYNHNLNTSEEFTANIVSTHTFEDRVRTVHEITEAGISPCSGGIIGMGESDDDIVSLAFALRDMEIESIPVNFYHPIEGTPLYGTWTLDPRKCLKALAMFRFVNPAREIRIAGGRELHLGSLQPLGLYAANSIFVSDYLTTSGQSAEDDYKMIADLGFTIATPAAERR
jgi:biotin synthase